MYEGVSFFIELLKQYGLYTAIGTMAILYVIKDIWKKESDLWLHTKRKIVLPTHSVFKEFDYLIEHSLKGNFNCQCRIRKALYRDIMVERLTCFKNCLLEFVKTDINSKEDYPTQYEFYLKVVSVLDEANSRARVNSINNGVPEFLLDEMEEHRALFRQCLHDILKGICYSEYSYLNNTQRMSAVLTNVVIFCKNYMDSLEEVLASFNGKIKHLNYKGVVCANCQICVHDEHINKLKKFLEK